MTGKTLFKDRRGTSAVEFALTAPVFILMFFGLWQIGYGLWWQFGLQHGAQMAARCMTVNTITPTNGCDTIANIQSYAAGQSYGLNPLPTIFIVSKNIPCGSGNGNQIAVNNYPVPPIVANIGIPTLTLNAQSCYPSTPA